jgi:hypothetical protein
MEQPASTVPGYHGNAAACNFDDDHATPWPISDDVANSERFIETHNESQSVLQSLRRWMWAPASGFEIDHRRPMPNLGFPLWAGIHH